MSTFCFIGCQLFAYKARFISEESYVISSSPQDGLSPRINFDNY